MEKLFSVTVIFLAFTLYSVQCQEPVCPTPTGNPVFFPDPTDCSRYYMCTDLVPIRLECPRPLLWDQRILACNHPGSVQCTTVRTTTTTTTEEPGTEWTEDPPETTEYPEETYEDIPSSST